MKKAGKLARAHCQWTQYWKPAKARRHFQAWCVEHNKTTCAIVSKIARICWAAWTVETSFYYWTSND